MGGGASAFDDGGEGNSSDEETILSRRARARYFCHTCSSTGRLPPGAELTCPNCRSTFLEEMSPEIVRPVMDNQRPRRRNELSDNELAELSADQSRRLANAASMLRVLESRLRDELEFIQRHATSAEADDAAASKPILSLTQTTKLKTPKLSIDLCCSQPSCPLCMEDYRVEETDVTQMPCSHIFHNACIKQWLDIKNSCPICREEISDAIPTLVELESRFDEDELEEKIKIAKKAVTAEETQLDDANGKETKVRAGNNITVIANSSLAARLAGSAAGGNSTTKENERTPPLSPSRRDLAQTLRETLVKHAEDQERKTTTLTSTPPLLTSPVAAHLRPYRLLEAGPRVLGGPIPATMMRSFGGLELFSTYDDQRQPRITQHNHPRSNPHHLGRFRAQDAQSSTNNQAALLQHLLFGALNAALESEDDNLPLTLPSLHNLVTEEV